MAQFEINYRIVSCLVDSVPLGQDMLVLCTNTLSITNNTITNNTIVGIDIYKCNLLVINCQAAPETCNIKY